MSVSLDSKGLNGAFSSSSIPPVNCFSDRFFNGGTYDIFEAENSASTHTAVVFIGVATNPTLSSSFYKRLYLRRDIGDSSVGIDTYGLRGFTDRTKPKIGQYIIKASGTSVNGGSYVAAWCGSTWANVGKKSGTEITDLKGIFYRYA